MKIHLKFNHEKNDTLEAIDCQWSCREVNDRVFETMRKFMEDDDKKTASELAEIVHNGLDYEEILFLATHSILDKMERMAKAQMADQLKNLLDELNDE